MSGIREKYVVLGVDLYHVRNRNERRVVRSMIEAISKKQMETAFSAEELKDIYAYALNLLEPRYVQQGTIVLRDPVRREHVDKAVNEAIALVFNNPKNGG